MGPRFAACCALGVALALASGLAGPRLASAAATSTSTASDDDVIVLTPEPLPPPTRTSTAVESIDLTPPDAIETEPGSDVSAVGGVVRRARSVIRLEGRLSVDTAFDQWNEHVAELGLGGHLELELELANRVSAFVAPGFYWMGGLTEDGDDRWALLFNMPEARVSWAFGPFDLRVGALIFNWGASDLVGPNDVLNPLDYRRSLIASLDNAKIPVLAAELVGALGPVTVRAVVAPFFTPSRFFVTTWDTAILPSMLPTSMGSVSLNRFNIPALEKVIGADTVDAVGDQGFLNARPSVRPDNATLALRATVNVGDVDLSLTGVHGWEAFPQVSLSPAFGELVSAIGRSLATGQVMVTTDLYYAVDASLRNGEPLFTGTYARRDQLGFDAVYALDPFVLKIDAAYVFARTSYTQGDYHPISTPWLDTVIGLEYASGDTFQLVVEAFAMTIFDIPSDVRLSFFEPSAPPPSTTNDGKRTIALPGLSAVLRYSVLDGDLHFELGGVATLGRGDVLFMPAVRYRLDDAEELMLGGVLIQGRDDGYGGAYAHDTQVFVEYHWTH